VEVFLSKIVGFILESQHSEFRHKMQVLDVLNNLSLDATSMLEIFMNYDCDAGASTDVFKQVVEHLSKAAKASYNEQDAVHGKRVSLLSLRVLYSYCTHTVLILYSYCTHTVWVSLLSLRVLYSHYTHTILILYR
jgi:Sec7-like guanine-nucleotide exchange factor